MAEVQTRLNHLTYEDCDKQDLSPLFTTLPGELRNEIFRWALIQYEDTAQAYAEDSYWFRPGFHGPKKSNSELLRTCKLVYLEARRVIAREAEHAFWFNRGPDGRTGDHACKRWFDGLNAQQAEDVTSVRFFTQLYWLEPGTNLNRIMAYDNFRPETVTITLRYSDWWFWEHNAALRMDETWLEGFEGPSTLREFRMEYETVSWKKDEMMAIIESNRAHKLKLKGDDGHLSAEGVPYKEWKWEGPSKFDGQSFSHHGDGDKMEYVVVVLRWLWKRGEMPEEDKALRQSINIPDLGEEYYEDWDDHDEDDTDNQTDEGEDDDAHSEYTEDDDHQSEEGEENNHRGGEAEDTDHQGEEAEDNDHQSGPGHNYHDGEANERIEPADSH